MIYLAEYNGKNDYLTQESAAAYRSKRTYEESETELTPQYTRQKSFYGKARVIKAGRKSLLRSYDTIVCGINTKGKFVRLWNDYSVTTMAHVNEYRQQNGMPALSKKEWNEMEVK